MSADRPRVAPTTGAMAPQIGAVMRNKPSRDPLDMPCWPWGRAAKDLGYGLVSVNGSIKQAHRYVYEALVEPIPEGLELDHLCRNPACVNPDHLEPVTHAENLRRGASSKLSYAKAEAIRRDYANGVAMRLLALEHGVTREAIRQVVNGVTWRKEAA